MSRGARLAIGFASVVAFALVVFTVVLNVISGLPLLGAAR
jgi:hypothetical protein